MKKAPDSSVKSGKNTVFKKKLLYFILFLVLAISIFSVMFSYIKFRDTAIETKKDIGKESQTEIKSLTDEVGKLYALPQGEMPTLATVTDVTKLADQPFFKKAKNGDKVLIFATAKEVILYRPEIKKIIAVAPVNPDTQNPQQRTTQATSSATQTVSKLKVVVLNSTKTPGLAKKGADLLDSQKAEILTTSNSAGEYPTTTVSSVSKEKTISDSDLKSLVSVFSKIQSKVTTLPKGEKDFTGADVVIILGSDFAKNY